MNIEIANDKEFFYQWDTGQILEITDDGSGSEVHIEKDDLMLACAIREENGVRLVDVPDLLLQGDGYLTAFLVRKVEDEVETLFSRTFRIEHRAKPEDYVCTETEILHYRDLAERITALEQNGGSTGGGIAQESDPTVPAWAKNPNKPTYTAAEVGALPADTKIPSTAADVGALPADTKIPTVPDKVSAFTNDAGYVTAEDLPTVPAALPNPNKLTFSGAVSAEYDGSSAVEVVIPAGGSGGGGEQQIVSFTAAEDVTQIDIPITEEMAAALNAAREILFDLHFELPSADEGTNFGTLRFGVAASWGFAHFFVLDDQCLPSNSQSYCTYYNVVGRALRGRGQNENPMRTDIAKKGKNTNQAFNTYASTFATITTAQTLRLTGSIPMGAGSTVHIYVRG